MTSNAAALPRPRATTRHGLAALSMLAALFLPLAAQAQNTYSFLGSRAIPDGSPAGLDTTLVVTDLGVVSDINLRIDAEPGCDATTNDPRAGIAHTFVGDLVITLISPAGTQAVLFERRGAQRRNFCATTFDDDGNFPSPSTLTGNPALTVSGNFVPEQPLSIFDGENPNGLWKLRVSDNHAVASGTLQRFSLVVTSAPIATIAVDVFGDPFPTACTPGSCSLREAIRLANDRPGRDRVLLPAGTYTLNRAGAGEEVAVTGDLDITEELEILGAGVALTNIVQSAADRVFDARAGTAEVVLRKLTVTGGGSVGTRPERGGAIASDGTRLLIEDAAFNGNKVSQRGGAIYYAGFNTINFARRPYVELQRVVFDGNIANGAGPDVSGGALYVYASGGNLRAVVIGESTFTNNAAAIAGGAFTFDGQMGSSNEMAVVSDSSFTGNSAGGFGGAISVEASAQSLGVTGIIVDNSAFENNATFGTDGIGGAIAAGFGVYVQNSTLIGNTASRGGAIHSRTYARIERSTLCGNEALNAGGAVMSELTLIVKRSTFCGNRVTTADTTQLGGGAVASDSVASFSTTIERSTFEDNDALRGGALAVAGGALDLRFNTLRAPLTVAPGTLGKLLRYTNTDTSAALIFFDTLFDGTCSYSTARVPTSALANIESPGNSCRLETASFSFGNLTGVTTSALALGVLAENGGPTQTIAPNAGSVALGHADPNGACEDRDQRDFAASDASCDAGAVERGGVPVSTVIFANGFE